MPLFKWVRDYVVKYSFITKTEFKAGIFYLYYENDGETYYKKLPYRVSRDKFIETIETIKHEINYYEKRAKRAEELRKDAEKDVPIIFANK